MLKNRKFVGKPSAMEGAAQGWYVIVEKTYGTFAAPYTRHFSEHYHMKRKLECNAQQVNIYYTGAESGIGQHEIFLTSGEVYEFAIVLKCRNNMTHHVSLTHRGENNVYASKALLIRNEQPWVQYTPIRFSRSRDGDLRITFSAAGSMDIGCVSLMNKNNFQIRIPALLCQRRKNDPSYASPSDIEESYRTRVAGVQNARDIIRNMRALPGNEKNIISFDEWNMWYGWYCPSCVPDGIFAGMMMHMFIGEAQNSGIGFACQFEAVNESAIKIKPGEIFLTATGQALALMKEHAGGVLRYADACAVATEKEGTVTVTIIHSSFDSRKTVAFDCCKERKESKLYESTSFLPHHRFDIRELPVSRDNEQCKVELPPHSMTVIRY